MAIVKFNSKTYDGISRVNIRDNTSNPEYGVINLIGYQGDIHQIPFIKGGYIRVECQSDLEELNSANCATVIGNVNYAKVGNHLEIEGRVSKIGTDKSILKVNKHIKVCYGPEKAKRSGIKIERAKIIHIDGRLLALSCNVSNQNIEIVTFGKVEEANIRNSLSVKGNVDTAVVHNIIDATME